MVRLERLPTMDPSERSVVWGAIHSVFCVIFGILRVVVGFIHRLLEPLGSIGELRCVKAKCRSSEETTAVPITSTSREGGPCEDSHPIGCTQQTLRTTPRSTFRRVPQPHRAHVPRRWTWTSNHNHKHNLWYPYNCELGKAKK